MAVEVGDMTYGQAQLIDQQSLDIVPVTVGEEWTVHNISIPYGYSCELYHTDGTNTIKVSTLTNSLLSYSFHCNLSSYYSIKNVSGYTIYVSYDGVVSQV
jgi:hypothetical protein